MKKNIIVQVCSETATCNSCHAANYGSKFMPSDRKRVEKLYEVHVGGITFRLCENCVNEMIERLQLISGEAIDKQITDPEELYQIVDTDEIPANCAGKRIPIIEFVEMIEEGYITDDDGFGMLVYENKLVTNSVVAPLFKEVYINPGEDYCSTFKLMDLPVPLGDSVDILWYNK